MGTRRFLVVIMSARHALFHSRACTCHARGMDATHVRPTNPAIISMHMPCTWHATHVRTTKPPNNYNFGAWTIPTAKIVEALSKNFDTDPRQPWDYAGDTIRDHVEHGPFLIAIIYGAASDVNRTICVFDPFRRDKKICEKSWKSRIYFYPF